MAAALAQPQVRHRDLVTQLPMELQGGSGSVALTRSGLRVDGQATGPRRPPPTLGQHTAEVLIDIANRSTA